LNSPLIAILDVCPPPRTLASLAPGTRLAITSKSRFYESKIIKFRIFSKIRNA